MECPEDRNYQRRATRECGGGTLVEMHHLWHSGCHRFEEVDLGLDSYLQGWQAAKQD